MRYVKLEYNEKKGLFHYAELGTPDSNNYEEVCKEISYDNAIEFTLSMHDIFIDFQNTPQSLKKVIEEFKLWLTK